MKSITNRIVKLEKNIIPKKKKWSTEDTVNMLFGSPEHSGLLHTQYAVLHKTGKRKPLNNPELVEIRPTPITDGRVKRQVELQQELYHRKLKGIG